MIKPRNRLATDLGPTIGIGYGPSRGLSRDYCDHVAHTPPTLVTNDDMSPSAVVRRNELFLSAVPHLKAIPSRKNDRPAGKPR